MVSHGVVESLDITESDEIFYNLTVASAHTYFVGEGGWLVHNACKYTELAAKLDSMTPDEFERLISGMSSNGVIRRKLVRDWLDALSPDDYQKLLDDIDSGNSSITRADIEAYAGRWQHKNGAPLVDELGRTYELHHGYPRDFRDFFNERGIDIDHPDNMFELPKARHTELPDGIHTGPYADSWNGRWEAWIRDNPNATRAEVLAFRDRLANEFGISEFLGQAPRP